jgi:hypothetical protein
LPLVLAAARFDKMWLDVHLQACKQYLGNKPLVLQEYNLPTCPQRSQYYEYVSETCAWCAVTAGM